MTILLLGALIGAALGLTGAGGGVLAVPLPMAGVRVPLTVAVPVSLTAVALAAALGTGLALRARQVRYRAAALMAAFGVVASPAGLWFAQRLPHAPLAMVFAALMVWIAWGMWRGRTTLKPADPSIVRAPCLLDAATGRLCWTPTCVRALAGKGAIAGTLSGLLGVGGGFVIVPGLRRFTDRSVETAVGTSLAVVALVSACGVAASAVMGHLDTPLAGRFALGAADGMVRARSVTHLLPPVLIRRGFALLAGTAALAMAWSAGGP